MNNLYSLGLVSVSFRQHTPKEILEAMKTAGLTHIEWGSDIHAPCNDICRLREIAKLQKEYKIKCSSYGTYFRLGETPIDELSGYITAAKILGTNILRLWCGNKSGAHMSNGERAELLSVCQKASAIAQASGITICLECHRKTFTEIPDDSVWLMRSVDSPNFRMYWQPFQWQSIEENLNNAQKIAPYSEHIHVFNWKGNLKLPLADALIEWKKYLSCFSNSKALLLEFMPNGSLSELIPEANALKYIAGETI